MATMPAGWDIIVPAERSLTPEDQALEAILNSGLGAELDKVIFDGRIHRFKTQGDKAREKSGWYIFYADRLPAGAFGSWRGDVCIRWCAKSEQALTEAERDELDAIHARIAAERAAEAKKQHEAAAAVCAEIWNSTTPASPEHPYLKRKGVGVHGLHQTGDGRLIMPVFIEGRLTSLQYIDADSSKQFHSGGEIACGYYMIPAESSEVKTLYVCEGFATGASIAEATNAAVIVALNAGNLLKVAPWVRDKIGAAGDLVIVADNDPTGIGQEKAAQAAALSKARVIIPPEPGDANDYAAAHGGPALTKLLEGRERWLVKGRDFYAQPAPIRWLIKKWIPRDSYGMVFGASGAGKSFVMVDMAMTIAAQLPEWNGMKVRGGPVVYLAGEGIHGMKARMAGWVQEHGRDVDDIYVSRSGCDLNTDAGYSQVVNDIDAWKVKPVLIIVDTLNRFMMGDENAASDARGMNNYCGLLMNRYGCSVLVVHHTGVNAEAKDRARGSSAFKGAMDVEIKIESNGAGVVLLTQMKSKDSALAPCVALEQKQISINGWFDEDGDPVTTLVLEPSDDLYATDGGKEKKRSKTAQKCLDAFVEAGRKHGTFDTEGRFSGVTVEDWRDTFYSMHDADENKSKIRVAFKRGRDELEESGEIAGEGEVYHFSGDFAEFRERAVFHASKS